MTVKPCIILHLTVMHLFVFTKPQQNTLKDVAGKKNKFLGKNRGMNSFALCVGFIYIFVFSQPAPTFCWIVFMTISDYFFKEDTTHQ